MRHALAEHMNIDSSAETGLDRLTCATSLDQRVLRFRWTPPDRDFHLPRPHVVRLDSDTWRSLNLEDGVDMATRAGIAPIDLEAERHGSVWRVRQSFCLDKETALFGLGQFESSGMNWRGKSQLLTQCYIGSPCPLLVSTGGWAVLWPAVCESAFDDGPQRMRLSAESVRAMEFYILLADSIDGQIAVYRELTGKAPLMPRYFYGFWQFYNRYSSFQEIHDVVGEYRRRGLPLDAIVQDWKYWEAQANEHWNSLELEPSRFPEPKENIAKIHSQHVKFMMTLWPAFGKATDNWRQMKAGGYLLDNIDLAEGAAEIYDAFNPAARDCYWKIIREKMLSIGVDALWMDGTEPDCGSGGAGSEKPYHENFSQAGETFEGPVEDVLSGFPLATTDGVYQHWREERADRCCILTRASFAGIQRNAAAVWSGDTHCKWDDFRRQIPMGVNLSMAGVPYWSHDIGGWLWDNKMYPKGAEDPAFAELHTRWFQFGAFSPMFRIHGSWSPREIYRFQAPFYEAHVAFLKLRPRLLPYLYSLGWRISHEGYTLMRGLAMDFPNDPKGHYLETQYMFGPAFLVAPVFEPMLHPAPEFGSDAASQMNRSGRVNVYLPLGAQWYDFWTNQKLQGGQTIPVEAPIDRMPLFVRAGSILPLGPVKPYADAETDSPLEIRIYAGSDGAFTLYDDDGRTYAYEHGEYQTRHLEWDDHARELRGAQANEQVVVIGNT